MTSSAIEKLWVIYGNPYDLKHTDEEKLGYSTDPRQYNLPDVPVLEEEEWMEVAHRIHAFRDPDTAYSHAYNCNLESVICKVYVLVNNQWQFDKAATNEFLDID